MSRTQCCTLPLTYTYFRLILSVFLGLRHIYIYTCGAISFTRYLQLAGISGFTEAIYQANEPQQVHHAEQRALLTYDDLRIGSNNVGPLRRNGANAFIVDLQQ